MFVRLQRTPRLTRWHHLRPPFPHWVPVECHSPWIYIYIWWAIFENTISKLGICITNLLCVCNGAYHILEKSSSYVYIYTYTYEDLFSTQKRDIYIYIYIWMHTLCECVVYNLHTYLYIHMYACECVYRCQHVYMCCTRKYANNIHGRITWYSEG